MKRAAAVLPCALFALSSAVSLAQPFDVGPVTDARYAKECGSCHVAFPPGLLPERSWRGVMGSLGKHFNENAEVSKADHDAILAYLVAHAADRGESVRARDIYASIPASQTPLRITSTPYIEGLHGGLLDPRFKGRPKVNTLAECGACHMNATRGSFARRHYVITDEEFRAGGR
jgi:hypothetical protein